MTPLSVLEGLYALKLDTLLFHCNVTTTIPCRILTGTVWQEGISVPDQILQTPCYLPVWSDDYGSDL